MNNKIIAIDFDGTLCENKYPEIGEANDELIWWLRNRQAEGDKLILWTCRVDSFLKKAIMWCYEQGLIFDAINQNLPEIIDSFGSDTRKVFANEYIDDKNVPFMLPYIKKENKCRSESYHKHLAELVKASGQEIIRRAEDLVGQGDLITDFQINLAFRQEDSVPTIEVVRSHINKKSAEICLNGLKKEK